jgi:STE24 endopeptidase
LARWLLAVPWVLASAAVVWQLAGAVLDSIGVILVFAAWLASGALTLWPPLESFLARVILRFRSLTATEQAVVETAWAAVTDRAGRSAHQFQLWISEADELNAPAHAGRTVAVTRRALEFPQPQVAAMLAHELAHHLGWHSAVSLLTFWYSLPVRIVVWLLRLVWSLAFVLASLVVQVAQPLGRMIGSRVRSDEGPMLALGVSLVALGVRVVAIVVPVAAMLYLALVYPWLLVIPVLPPVAAALERAEEHRADRVAYDLGYGRDLVDVFRWVALRVRDTKLPWWQRLLATHPAIGARSRRVERYLVAQEIGGIGPEEPPG